MPTYDYECDACGHKFELFQSISESVKRKCPECSKSKLRRLFGTGGAIVFKGSGFYQTDYRSESYKKGEKAAKDKKSESGESKKSESGESKKSESGESKKSESGESKKSSSSKRKPSSSD